MTDEHFHKLAEVDQLQILIQYGILIGEILEKDCRIFMYQVDDFYVEIKYALENDDLVDINSFSKMDPEDRSQSSIVHLCYLPKKSIRIRNS